MLNFIYFPLFYYIIPLQNVFPYTQLTSLYATIVIVEEFVDICFETVCYDGFRLQVTEANICLDWLLS